MCLVLCHCLLEWLWRLLHFTFLPPYGYASDRTNKSWLCYLSLWGSPVNSNAVRKLCGVWRKSKSAQWTHQEPDSKLAQKTLVMLVIIFVIEVGVIQRVMGRGEAQLPSPVEFILPLLCMKLSFFQQTKQTKASTAEEWVPFLARFCLLCIPAQAFLYAFAGGTPFSTLSTPCRPRWLIAPELLACCRKSGDNTSNRGTGGREIKRVCGPHSCNHPADPQPVCLSPLLLTCIWGVVCFFFFFAIEQHPQELPFVYLFLASAICIWIQIVGPHLCTVHPQSICFAYRRSQS